MQFPTFETSPTFRLFTVLAFTVALAVPIALVWLVVEVRSEYEQEVSEDISQGWGDEQVLIGPFLRLTVRAPSNTSSNISTGDMQTQSHFIAPQVLSVKSSSKHEVRQKGIFKKPVYVVTVQLVGTFQNDLAKFTERHKLAFSHIESCSIQLAVSYSQTIRTLEGQIGDRELDFEPSSQRLGWAGEPVQARLDDAQCFGGDFQLNLVARGSNRQLIALVGDESTLAMEATWPHPSFEGRQLPDNYEISSTGFTADWTSNALARGFASELNENEWMAISEDSAVGFSFHEPVSLYRMVTRAIKYGFFVVGLTLLSIYCLEMITAAKIHAVQYAIVGAALALFYLLLLSFSEHIGFIPSYVVASAVLVLLIVGYAWFSTRKKKFVGSLVALLIGAYAALYLCLASTDYALLIGSILLVVLITGLMYATRNMLQDVKQLEER
ncbi:MAG: cell envelope integrity protein CreD [Gammaproteobacteria bacterium]|nr:cell envelope integrity protein CreD [Gammaproteobacteria bacterium]